MLKNIIQKFTEKENLKIELSQPIGEIETDSRAAPELIESHVWTLCRPWCEHCRCYMARELTWSDGSTETRCYVCRKQLSEWPDHATSGDIAD